MPMLARFKNKSPLFFIYMTIFINLVGFGMVFPLLPFYAKQFNASEAVIGIMASTFAIAQFIFSPIWGRVSDKYGRKPVISIALLGLSLSFMVFAVAQDLTWLFISRFLQGVFSAAALPVAQAYVADVTSKEDRIKGMGNLGAALALGFIFGPAIGGLLSSIKFELPFIAASVVAFINLVSVRIFLPESLTKRAEKLNLGAGFLNIKSMFTSLKGDLGSFFILVFLWSYGLSNNQVAVPLFGSEKLGLGANTVGLYFSLMGVISAFVQWYLLSKVTKKIGENKTAVLGLGIMAGALFLMPFSFTGPMMATFMMVVSFGSAIARPTINTLISKNTHEGQGATMGVASAFESFGRIVGPLLGGFLFWQFGYIAPFAVYAFVLVAALIFVIKRKQFLKG